MQRSIVLALSILMVATIGIPANAGHPSNCEKDTSGTIIIPIAAAIGGQVGAGFVPNCVEVNTGTEVTWRNDDTAAVCTGSTCFSPHDVESGELGTPTHGTCFRYSSLPPKGTGDSSQMQFTETFKIRVNYEHNGYGYLNVSTWSGTAWNPWMNCSSTIFWAESDTTHATIKYQCHVHHGMQGRLIVVA